MQNFIKKLHNLAKKNPKHIVFAEGEEKRILEAIEIIQKEKIAYPILLGNKNSIIKNAEKLKLKINWNELEIHNPKTSKLKEKYTKDLFELRKNKGLTISKAKELINQTNYFGTMMVQNDNADGMVIGIKYSTADAIRPALQIIKTKEKFHKVSGVFFILLEDRLLLFADTAITINPSAHDLVDITIDTAETAKKFNIEAKVALLSFSTKGSAKHPEINKIKEALAIIKNKKPDLIIDGELQVDAALIKKVAKIKCPNSPIKGEANILIFPNLEAANISYKLVERLAKAKAIGPILQGLKKPINDLSRGCTAQDIVNITAFTACECK